MEKLFEQFTQERRYLKNVTAKTESWYWQSWKALGEPVVGRGRNATPTKADWTTHVAALMERGVSPVSINTYARAMNAFLRWAYSEGHLEELCLIPRLKVEQRIIATLNQAQIQRVLAFRPKTFSQHRLYALLCLLLDTGLRINEALTLQRESIDLDNLLITVKGKGEKYRVVPMSFELRKTLYRWLTKHDAALVFPTRNGTRLSHRNSLREFKMLGRRLGIAGVRVSFHTLRHTFAVNYLRAGGNVFYLQRILGHTTLEMTNRYVRSLGIEDLQAVHSKLSLLTNV